MRKQLFHLLILLLIFPTLFSYSQNLSTLDMDRAPRKALLLNEIKRTMKNFDTEKTYQNIGMELSKSRKPFVQSMIIRSMLKGIKVKDTIDAMAKINEFGIRNFLKSVCYVEENLWCYLGVQDKNNPSKHIELKDLTKATVENSFWVLELLFDRYNENLNNDLGNQVRKNFKSWDPQYGPIILSLYQGNYIDDIQTARGYIEQI